MSKKYRLEDCLPDDHNFNKHTQRGMGLLEKSVSEVGVIESVTVSADNKVISGNARQEVMVQKFEGVQPILVETDGTKPIIIKRTDIKSGTKQFHKAALLANTVSKHNISLDLEKIKEVAVDEYDLDIEELGVDTVKAVEAHEEEEGGSSIGQHVKVRCASESEAQALYERLIEQGYDAQIVP